MTCRPSKLWFALLAAVAFAMPAGVAHADIYKFVDSEGCIHFSNTPETRKPEKVVHEEFRTASIQPSTDPDTSDTRSEKPAKTGRVITATPSAPDNKPAATSALDQQSSVVSSLVPSYAKDDSATPFADIINEKCDKYGVDPALVKSVIKAESNFNPRATSPKGARGLMQLMPSTAADMGVSDMYDPAQNIDGGVKYLKYLLGNFNGDVELTVAAYNCGQGRVIRNGFCVPEIAETKNYVKKVLKLSENPLTGKAYSRAIYKVEMKDGSIMFTDSPGPNSVAMY